MALTLQLLDLRGHFRLPEVQEPASRRGPEATWHPLHAELVGSGYALIAGTAGAILLDLGRRAVRWHVAGPCGAAAIDVAHERLALALPGGSSPSGVFLFDLGTRQATRLALPAGLSARALAFSPNGWFLAAAVEDAALLFEVGTGRLRWRWDGELPGMSGLAFSPDGSLLAAASAHHPRVALLHVDGLLPVGGWRLDPVGDAPAGVHGLAFSPGGRLLVAGVTGGSGGDAVLRAWDVTERRETHGFGAGAWPSFSPDGRRLAAVDAGDGVAVRVWDVPRCEEVAALPAAGDGFGAADHVRFSPDGRSLVTWAEDGVRVWTDGTERCRVLAVAPVGDAPARGRRPPGWRRLIARVRLASPAVGTGGEDAAALAAVPSLVSLMPIRLAFGPDGLLEVRPDGPEPEALA